MNDRLHKLLGDLDPEQGRGMEIGALDRPVIKRPPCNVLYVDYTNTEGLRTAYKDDASADVNNLVDVDIVWTTRPLKECIPDFKPLDYVVASHVIEHVPDLLGWLLDLRAVLKDGGQLSLAIPDRRFTFDYRRNESTLGEVIEAYRLKYRKPSIRQTFDFSDLAAIVDTQKAWSTNLSKQVLQSFAGDHTLDWAFKQSEILSSDNPPYFDTHCWVFTPESILKVFRKLALLGLFPFKLTNMFATDRNDLEFFMQLKADSNENRDAILTSIDVAAQIVAESPTESEYRKMVYAASA